MRPFFGALIVWLVAVTSVSAETDPPAVKGQSGTKHVRKETGKLPKAPSLSLDHQPIATHPVTRSFADPDDKALHVGGITVTPGGFLEMGTQTRGR